MAMAAAATPAAANFTMSQAGSDFQEGTVQPPVEQITIGQSSTTGSIGDYMAPFSTDEPSDLFQRYDTLTTFAPIINVASDLLTQPLPTNKWWGNLIHTTAKDIDTVASPAWSNPYALKLPKEAPYGLQACYSYTYRSMANEVDGVVKYYLHAFHNDLTLSATEFESTKPDYEIYSFSDMGASVRTCVSGSDNCMDSSLVNGMAFVSATYSGLTASIESEYAMTLVDDSTAGKYVIQLQNNQMWVVYSSDTSATFSIDSTGSALVSSAAYTVEVLADATTMEMSGAIVLHSTTRGQMIGQVTTSGSWKLTEDEADDEVDFYPASKPSTDIVSQINLLSTLQSDIDSDWSLNTGSWYFNGKAYQNVSYPEETGSFLVGHGTTGNMVWTLLRDVANPSSDDTYFPKFRHFSWFLGHSYSHGVTPMADAKDEESTSEDVNFFYGMMLWGKVTEKKAVEDLGSLMLRLNARAVRTYFLMTSDNTIHPPQFVPNHITGIFFDNKADYATWFSAEKYCIHGIQMIPVSPINRLVRTKTFIQEEWDDILSKEAIVTRVDTTNAWLSLLLVNQAHTRGDHCNSERDNLNSNCHKCYPRCYDSYSSCYDSYSSCYDGYSSCYDGYSGCYDVATTATPVATTATPVDTTATPVTTTATPVATAVTPVVTTATPTVTPCTPPATANPKAGVTTSSSWKDTHLRVE
eukprot:jgi/Phyca11/13631/fgenesh1_pg.PHYCAscaffold_4_\